MMGWAADGVEREAFPAEIFEIHFVELEKIARQIFFVEPSVVVFSKKSGAHNLRNLFFRLGQSACRDTLTISWE